MSQSSSYPCHPCHPWLKIFARMFDSDVLQCKDDFFSLFVGSRKGSHLDIQPMTGDRGPG